MTTRRLREERARAVDHLLGEQPAEERVASEIEARWPCTAKLLRHLTAELDAAIVRAADWERTASRLHAELAEAHVGRGRDALRARAEKAEGALVDFQATAESERVALNAELAAALARAEEVEREQVTAESALAELRGKLEGLAWDHEQRAGLANLPPGVGELHEQIAAHLRALLAPEPTR